MAPSILKNPSLKSIRSSIEEIGEQGDIPFFLESKAVEVTSNKKFMEFLENLEPRDNPNLFLFSVRDEAAQREEIQRKLEEKFPARPLILEFVDEAFFKENKEFEKVADQMSGVGKLLKDFHSLSEENFVEEVKNSLNVLSIRLLNIFEISVVSKIEVCKKIIEKSDDINLLYAVLDIPFGFPSPVLSPSSEEIIKTCIDDDPVLEAVISSKRGNFIVKNFKKMFNLLSFNKKKKVAAMALATNSSAFSSLIENGFPFPTKFDGNRNDIEAVIKRRELHDALDNKNVEKVKELASRKGIYYDFLNRSLLKRALETEQFELYVFLKAQGFIFGENGENDVEILEDTIRRNIPGVSDKQIKQELAPYKKRIDEVTLNYATPNDRKVTKVLTSRSYIHDRDESEYQHKKYFDKIEGYFEDLYGIDDLKPLLKIASLCDVEFHFDFSEKYIHNIVVGATGTMGQASWNAFHSNGRIIIGAKDKRVCISTLAHEMCHIAMRYLYNNNWLPYNDTVNETRFKGILDECKDTVLKQRRDIQDESMTKRSAANFVSENIVPRVFACYDESSWSAELIVRVPEMFAYFNKDSKLGQCKKLYESLFEYYNDKVQKDLNDFNPKVVELTEELNYKFGLFMQLDVDLQKFYFTWSLDYNCLFVSTKAPTLALNDIKQCLRSQNVLFVNPEMFKHETIRKDYEELHQMLCNQGNFGMTTIVVDLSENVSKELLEVALKPNFRYIFVTRPTMDVNVRDIISNQLRIDRTFTLEYDWNFLTYTSKRRLKSKIINFQNNKLVLSGVITDETIFDEEFIDACLSTDLIVNPFQKLDGVYIERQFSEKIEMEATKEDGTKVTVLETLKEKFSESESLERSVSSKIVIISNEAGCGKSQTLKRIQHKFDGLVYLMDLKEIFGKIKVLEGPLDFKKCFASTFIGDRSIFERKLFEHLYDKQKVIVLLDGYDEVYPDCKTQITDLANGFNGKQLWITNRDHLELELRGKLTNSFKVYTLVDLDKIERQRLFEDYIKDQKIQTEEDYKTVSKHLDEKLHHGLGSSDSIENPYLIKLFVDSCTVDNKIVTTSLDQFTKFDIYKKALRRKLENWIKEKGENAFNMSVMTQEEDESFVKVHRFYAMKQALPDVDLDNFEIFIRNWTPEEVIRCGIITRFVKDRPMFQHSTLGDFYVADFVIYGVKNSKVLLEKYFKLLLEVLLNSQKFYVVNMFISGSLKDQKFSDNRMEILVETFENLIKTGKFEKIFVTSILENYKSLYEFLLKLFAKVSDEAKEKQLERELKFQPKDVEFKSANEFFISRTENFEKIMKNIISELSEQAARDKMLEMLQKCMEGMRRNSIIGKDLHKIVEQIK